MVSCAVRSCTSRNNVDTKKSTGITFHRFPKDRRLDAWIKFVGRGSWEVSKYSVLCSKHFSEEYFDRCSASYVRLRDNAIPTLNPAQVHQQTSLPTEETSTPTIPQNIVVVSMTNILSANADPLKIIVYETPESNSEPSSISTSQLDPPVTISERKLMNTLERATLVSRERKQKLEAVRKRLYRSERRIEQMKAIIAELRNSNKIRGNMHLSQRKIQKS